MDPSSCVEAFLVGFCLYGGLYAFCYAVNAISRSFTSVVDV